MVARQHRGAGRALTVEDRYAVHHDKDSDVSVFVCDDIWNDWIPLKAFGAPTETLLCLGKGLPILIRGKISNAQG